MLSITRANTRISDVAARANQALKQHPNSALRQVIAETSEGRIVLSGNLGSYYAKQIAQEAVFQVSDGIEIENRIRVRKPYQKKVAF